ncbi:hypothetical protein [Saliniramus sp.]|nr:hypothetical protein [Saliniramus sp.]HMB10726.1 hypothetical protein [Saliniramus sp.]
MQDYPQRLSRGIPGTACAIPVMAERAQCSYVMKVEDEQEG